MRPGTPSARSRWRTKVVLPAPSGPCSSMKASRSAGGRPAPARRRRRRPRRARDELRVSRIGCMRHSRDIDGPRLVQRLQAWAHELGFSQIGVADVDLAGAEPGLLAWLAAGFHGRHGLHGRAWPEARAAGRAGAGHVQRHQRAHGLPAARPPPTAGRRAMAAPAGPGAAVVSIYARGRDYHKVLRPRLQRLADRLQAEVGPFGHRAFTDSAPVLEVELATRSGLGWRGKHTLALHREGGSMFFLGRDLRRPRAAAHRPVTPLRPAAAPASTSAPRRPSWRPTGWTRGAASPT
jgi:hypothetical protein